MAALTMDEADSTPNLSPRPDAGALVPAGDKWSVVRNNVAQEMTDRKELNDVFAERERIRKAAEKVTKQIKPSAHLSTHHPHPPSHPLINYAPTLYSSIDPLLPPHRCLTHAPSSLSTGPT